MRGTKFYILVVAIGFGCEIHVERYVGNVKLRIRMKMEKNCPLPHGHQKRRVESAIHSSQPW